MKRKVRATMTEYIGSSYSAIYNNSLYGTVLSVAYIRSRSVKITGFTTMRPREVCNTEAAKEVSHR